jgi:hypothetical protein
MYRSELKKLEGVWNGTERIIADDESEIEATARLVFQTVFDGRFLTCDYIQTVPERPQSVAHGVFPGTIGRKYSPSRGSAALRRPRRSKLMQWPRATSPCSSKPSTVAPRVRLIPSRWTSSRFAQT